VGDGGAWRWTLIFRPGRREFYERPRSRALVNSARSRGLKRAIARLIPRNRTGPPPPSPSPLPALPAIRVFPSDICDEWPTIDPYRSLCSMSTFDVRILSSNLRRAITSALLGFLWRRECSMKRRCSRGSARVFSQTESIPLGIPAGASRILSAARSALHVRVRA